MGRYLDGWVETLIYVGAVNLVWFIVGLVKALWEIRKEDKER